MKSNKGSKINADIRSSKNIEIKLEEKIVHNNYEFTDYNIKNLAKHLKDEEERREKDKRELIEKKKIAQELYIKEREKKINDYPIKYKEKIDEIGLKIHSTLIKENSNSFNNLFHGYVENLPKHINYFDSSKGLKNQITSFSMFDDTNQVPSSILDISLSYSNNISQSDFKLLDEYRNSYIDLCTEAGMKNNDQFMVSTDHKKKIINILQGKLKSNYLSVKSIVVKDKKNYEDIIRRKIVNRIILDDSDLRIRIKNKLIESKSIGFLFERFYEINQEYLDKKINKLINNFSHKRKVPCSIIKIKSTFTYEIDKSKIKTGVIKDLNEMSTFSYFFTTANPLYYHYMIVDLIFYQE